MAITRHQYRVYVKAPVEQVWNAILDPEFTRLGAFLKELVETSPQIETELRQGMSGEMLTLLTRQELDVGFYLGLPEGLAGAIAAFDDKRRARWLAARGHRLTAVDRDAQALAGLEAVARVVCADIENGPWPLAGDTFDAVVVTNYLWRPLWPDLLACLQTDGVLIYETFASGNESVGKPSNPDFLLRPGELLEAVRGQLRVVVYEDVFVELPKPAMVQRICAVRSVS